MGAEVLGCDQPSQHSGQKGSRAAKKDAQPPSHCNIRAWYFDFGKSLRNRFAASSSGSLAKFAASRRASSFVSSFAAEWCVWAAGAARPALL
jgi:hypothetical protein